MDNDRSWMHVQGLKGRLQPSYRNGVKYFLDFAFKDTNPNSGDKKRCSCLNCRNYFDHDRSTMRVHLFRVGIDPDYNPWVFHGEEQSLDIGEMEMSEEEGDELYDEDPLVSEEMTSLVHDATNVVREEHDGDEGGGDCSEIPDKFYKLMKDAEEELFSGCKTFSRLEFIVTLLHLKELEAQACENENEVTEINGSSSNVTSSQAKDDPMYLKLWEKSKRHKNGKFDDEAEEKFKELKELHEKEIGEKGVDNLTLEEAYVKVLGHRSGYARGLGKGHPVSSKDGKIGRAELEQNVEKLQNENNIMRAELEASKKKQEDLEQKLRLIMEKIGLDA
uniref:Transposase-associated domain-containing protein n=1 Tax=Chenopodium quinoa TaxID=63459 RepID=A0A803M0Q9_CHEQI